MEQRPTHRCPSRVWRMVYAMMHLRIETERMLPFVGNQFAWTPSFLPFSRFFSLIIRWKVTMRIWWILQLFLWTAAANCYSQAQGVEITETLVQALAAGHVTVQFRATGASSGDSVLLTITKTAAAPSSTLSLTVAAGLRLNNITGSGQSMVVERVRGKMINQRSYVPGSTIVLSDTNPATYMLSAYCAEFHKDNPSPDSMFGVALPEPTLSCILTETARQNLSLAASQAAVWNYTDRITFQDFNRRLSIGFAEWTTAVSVTQSCLQQDSAATGRSATSSTVPSPIVTSSPNDFVPSPATRVETAARVLTEIMSTPDKGIPSVILGSAKCLIVAPSLQRGDGIGVASCRTDSGWSAPAVLRFNETSVGMFNNAPSFDLVLLIMTDHAMQFLLHDKFTPGAVISAEAGPVGRLVRNDLRTSIDVYTCVRYIGLFAGVTLKHAAITQDRDATRQLFGKGLSLTEILTGAVEIPQAGIPFLRSLPNPAKTQGPR